MWGQGYPQNAELASLPLFMEQAVATGKEQAGLELDSYKNLRRIYREAQQKELAEAIAGGKAAIQAADTVEGIQTALAEAKTAMDAIKTDAQLTEEELGAVKAEGQRRRCPSTRMLQITVRHSRKSWQRQLRTERKPLTRQRIRMPWKQP